MFTRQITRLTIGIAALAFFTVVLFFSEPVSSAGRGDKSAPTAPANLVVTAVTETSISLAWNPSTDNSGKFSYKLRITNLNNSAYNSLATISQTQTTHTATFLNSNSAYSFSVFAVDGSGNRSLDSNVANASTLKDSTPPSTPVLQAAVLGPSQVQLTWTKSTDNIPNHCCSYSINMNGSKYTQHINWVAAPPDKLSATIRHLPPGSTNSFSISVSDWSGGNVATSNTATATTHPSNDRTPPSVPTSLRILADNSCDDEVWLGWNEASDDTDGQNAIEYEIYVNGVLSPLPISAGIDFDFVYANPAGESIFTVKAVDRSGNTSAASSAVKMRAPC